MGAGKKNQSIDHSHGLTRHGLRQQRQEGGWDLPCSFSCPQPGLKLTQESVWGGAVAGTVGSVSTSMTRTPSQKSPNIG